MQEIRIGQRMMTISTVGVPNTIKMLASHKLQSTLAVRFNTVSVYSCSKLHACSLESLPFWLHVCINKKRFYSEQGLEHNLCPFSSIFILFFLGNRILSHKR